MPGISLSKFLRILVFALPIVLFLAGLFGFIYGTHCYTPLDQGIILPTALLYALPAFALFLIGAILLLKGRSSSHREVIAIFFISLVAFPLGLIGLCFFLNGALDRAEPQTHTTLIHNKYRTRSEDQDSYYAVVESWRGKAREKISIRKSVYDRIQINRSHMEIKTKPGHLGFEWIVSYQLIPQPEAITKNKK